MSLVPILANGFCANPTAQQERARALYSTSRSLMCDGVVAHVCDKPDGCLKVVVTKCIETPQELTKELKIPNPDIELEFCIHPLFLRILKLSLQNMHLII